MNPPDVNSLPDAASVWLDLVKRKVEAMRFGSVQIVVHDGRVTTVEATEKTRLPSSPADGPSIKG